MQCTTTLTPLKIVAWFSVFVASLGILTAHAQESTVALALPISRNNDEPRYNLVLFLYNTAGSPTVVERAAVTKGSTNEIGTEVQELEQMRGQQFHRDVFRVDKNWLRDIDLDGYKDLSLPTSARGAAAAFAIFLFNPRRNRFEFLSEYSEASDTATKVSFGRRGTTRHMPIR